MSTPIQVTVAQQSIAVKTTPYTIGITDSVNNITVSKTNTQVTVASTPITIKIADTSPHGINVEGLKRRGFSSETISALRQAYKVLYKDGLSFEDAKVEIQKMISASAADAATVEKLTEFHDFIAASTRGIIR